jgi:integrase
VLLAVIAGLRRGEICALRWRNINLSVIGSTEQVKRTIRKKTPKSGRARTGALATLAVEELTRHKPDKPRNC